MTLITYFEALFLKEIEYQKAAITVYHPEVGRALIIGKSTIRPEDAFEALDKFIELELVDVIIAVEDDKDSPAFYTVSDKGLEELKKFSLYPIKRAIPKFIKP